MRILLTGTGAADGVPAMFADSEVSEYARTHGGKEMRLRASALVDDVLRIDFPADTLAQIHRFGLRAKDWKAILITHSHDDHLDVKELQYFLPPFVPLEIPRPVIYGNEAVLKVLGEMYGEGFQKKELKSFQKEEICGYEVIPIRAYHKLDEESLNFLIRKDGKTLLYATDTGYYQQETWDFLRDWKLDLAIMECTDGFAPTEYWGHLSCEDFLRVVEKMRQLGCVSEKTKFVTTHHAHAGMATHKALEEFFLPHGIDVGFDGMLLEI
ncbi:MAG TPA: MBL fold metallo-hydrolase [Fimbriimonadales bacterium]|nr:MBL fold metallo-hydrolase [Fimbriimonadales bacterium]